MAILSYREGMELVESYVKQYSIYVLKNPENGEVFYVGKTSKELKVRLSGHMGDLGSPSAKGKYLKELFDNDGWEKGKESWLDYRQRTEAERELEKQKQYKLAADLAEAFNRMQGNFA